MEWQNKYADKEPEIQQIEIIKPVIEIKKEPSVLPKDIKKSKKSKDSQPSADALNSFIKKLAGEEKPIEEIPEPAPVVEAPIHKPKKT